MWWNTSCSSGASAASVMQVILLFSCSITPSPQWAFASLVFNPGSVLLMHSENILKMTLHFVTQCSKDISNGLTCSRYLAARAPLWWKPAPLRRRAPPKFFAKNVPPLCYCIRFGGTQLRNSVSYCLHHPLAFEHIFKQNQRSLYSLLDTFGENHYQTGPHA